MEAPRVALVLLVLTTGCSAATDVLAPASSCVATFSGAVTASVACSAPTVGYVSEINQGSVTISTAGTLKLTADLKFTGPARVRSFFMLDAGASASSFRITQGPVSWIAGREGPDNADGSSSIGAGSYTLVLTSVNGSTIHGTLDGWGLFDTLASETVHVEF
jgi:hypothetical protein